MGGLQGFDGLMSWNCGLLWIFESCFSDVIFAVLWLGYIVF